MKLIHELIYSESKNVQINITKQKALILMTYLNIKSSFYLYLVLYIFINMDNKHNEVLQVYQSKVNNLSSFFRI